MLHVARGASSSALPPRLPLCFLDGSLVDCPEALDRLYESGELMRAFGGEMLVRLLHLLPP